MCWDDLTYFDGVIAQVSVAGFLGYDVLVLSLSLNRLANHSFSCWLFRL